MPSTTICYFANVSEAEIITAIKSGAVTLKDVTAATGAGKGDRCKELNPKGRCCHPEIVAIIKKHAEANDDPKPPCSCCS